MIDWATVAGCLLVTSGISVFAGPLILRPLWVLCGRVIGRMFGGSSSPSKRDNTPPARSADAPPPPGFSEHVEVILSASEGAPSLFRIGYLIDANTEAETLRREVARMRKGVSA